MILPLIAPFVVPLIGAAISLGSAIFGGVKSAQQNKKARRLIKQQRNENKDWNSIKQSQDYTQRVDYQAANKLQQQMVMDRYKTAAARNAVAGGTDEALALQKQAANQALAQTETDLAARAADYNDSIERQYRAQDAALNQQQVAGYQQQAVNTSAAASQAALMGSGLGSVASSAGAASKAAADVKKIKA